MKREQLKKVRQIIKGTLHLDEESTIYIIGSLNIGLDKNIEYFKFRLRTDMLKNLELKYPVTYTHMEKHLSVNIREAWPEVEVEDAYRDLGIVERPTPKIIVMLLLEKLQKKEI